MSIFRVDVTFAELPLLQVWAGLRYNMGDGTYHFDEVRFNPDGTYRWEGLRGQYATEVNGNTEVPHATKGGIVRACRSTADSPWFFSFPAAA